MIPRKIHFIWLGSPLPTWAEANIDRFRELNPGHEICLWESPEALLPSWTVAYDRAQFVYQRVDLLRYSILQALGGWCFDPDCIAFRPLSALDAAYEIGERLFLFRYKPGSAKHINNAILASLPDSPAWLAVNRHVTAAIDRGDSDRCCYGPGVFRRAIEDTPEAFCVGEPHDFGEPHDWGALPPAEWPDGRVPFVYHVGHKKNGDRDA